MWPQAPGEQLLLQGPGSHLIYDATYSTHTTVSHTQAFLLDMWRFSWMCVFVSLSVSDVYLMCELVALRRKWWMCTLWFVCVCVVLCPFRTEVMDVYDCSVRHLLCAVEDDLRLGVVRIITFYSHLPPPHTQTLSPDPDFESRSTSDDPRRAVIYDLLCSDPNSWPAGTNSSSSSCILKVSQTTWWYEVHLN